MPDNPTVNETILDLGVRHQVGLQRMASGTLKKIIAILDRADADLVAQLQARTATLEGSIASQRLDYLLQAVREISRDANVALGNELRQDLRDLAKYEASYQIDLLDRAIPVAVDIVSPSAQMLNAVVTSKPLHGRFLKDWLADLDTGRRRRLTQAIQLGMVQGENVDQIVKRVRGTKALNYRDGVLAVNRRQAENLVRTAVNHVSNAARQVLYEENTDLIKGVQWVSTLDSRTCPICAGRDGTVFKIDAGPRPPAHPSCRCTTVPVTKSWRELGIDVDEVPAGTRASMNGQVAETTTYGEWLKAQSAEVQDDALGATRAALFRKGGLSVDRFTDVRGNQLTLEQLRQRESAAFEKAGLAA